MLGGRTMPAFTRDFWSCCGRIGRCEGAPSWRPVVGVDGPNPCDELFSGRVGNVSGCIYGGSSGLIAPAIRRLAMFLYRPRCPGQRVATPPRFSSALLRYALRTALCVNSCRMRLQANQTTGRWPMALVVRSSEIPSYGRKQIGLCQ